MDNLDYKKEYKELYLPKTTPSRIVVPPIAFIMVDGAGDPNEYGGEYERAVGTLYALAYTIKMSAKKGNELAGYFDYVIPPLEGLWWYDDGGAFRPGEKDHFCWTMMLRQPEFVNQEIFNWACREVSWKKPELATAAARLDVYGEGLCIQCLHIGPYDTEPETVKKMELYMKAQKLTCDFSDTRRHHEIYLSDPRKTEHAKLKTVLRHPVKTLALK